MQLVCPHCGQPIPAEQINIQRMAAVCPACNTVFEFSPSDSKVKRRKVKQPTQVTSDESDNHLNLAFRTNFRLDQSQAFLTTAIASLIFTFITALMIVSATTKPQVIPVALGFSLLTLALYYYLALLTYNKTHIEVSDEEISVSRKPLPNLLTPPNTIGLSGVKIIRYEETAASQKEGYDTPRYNVWAESEDGNHKLIVGDVIEDYAVYLSQRLNEFLDLYAAPDVSRLSDDDRSIDDRLLEDSSTRPESHRK